MKTRIIISLLLSLLAMVVAPLVAIYCIGSNDAIGILFLLLAVLNPIVSIVIGVISGGKKVLWYLPVINAVIYLASYGIMVMFDFTLIATAVVYVGLGLGTAYIVKAIKSKKAE